MKAKSKLAKDILKIDKWKIALKYCLCFIVFYILSKTNINGQSWFAFGALFALVWCNQNIFVLSPLYITANILADFSILSAISCVGTIFVILICYGIHYKLKKPMSPVLLSMYAVLSQSISVAANIYFGNNIIITFAGVAVGMIFMLCATGFLSGIFTRGTKYIITTMDAICGGVVLIVFSMGITQLNIGNFETIKLFACSLILIFTYCFGTNVGVICSALMGVGSMFAINNAVFVAPFLIWSLVTSVFKSKQKVFCSVCVFLVETIMGYLLNVYYLYDYINLIPVFVSCFAYLVIPEKVFDYLKCFFESSKEKLAMRNVVNRSREVLSQRLTELSVVFGDMGRVFRAMLSGGITDQQANEILTSQIKQNVCENCPEKSRCHRSFCEETNEVFGDLINCAMERGKATLLDIPPFLTARCTRLNNLISCINELTMQYKKYSGIVSSVDESKLLVAEQLGGVSKIMNNLASEVNKNVSFDFVREDKIIEELAFHHIVCSDVAIYEQNTNLVSATLLVRNQDANKSNISKIVSKICGTQMDIASQMPSTKSGWQVVTLKTACKYDVIFGTASEKKPSSKISGDCFSLLRIESDKFLLALCDGMGSGEKAEKTSELTIGLVENFYKAGFDNDMILSSVNKLLSVSNEETFSTIDLSVIDLRKGIADFIKLGSPSGFIKHEDTTEVIKSGSLPLGIVGDVQPVIKKMVISANDMLVLCTDGIYDTFETEQEFADYVNNLISKNPQIIADSILEKAKQNSGQYGACDDMTVLVARMIQT